MEINIKKLHEDSIIPTRGSEEAAGYDLYAYLEDEKTDLNMVVKFSDDKIRDDTLQYIDEKIFTLNNLHWRKLFHNKPNEIEKCNIKLRISQTKLNLIKENSIKDMIYSIQIYLKIQQ